MAAKKPVRAPLDRCINVSEVEDLARRKMKRAGYDYYAGGSEDERTLEGNRTAFSAVFLRPRVLVDVSRIDPSTTALGAAVSTPILLAPAALQKIAHPDGELATVRAAVRGRAEVYVDGGVRRGTDAMKSLALGARAAFIGRPYLWGLAAGGEKGVSRVLTLLREEFELAMTLCGTPTVAAIKRSLVAEG